MRQPYLLIPKSEYSDKIEMFLKKQEFIFQVKTVTLDLGSIFKDYYVFQLKTIYQEQRKILCFGRYFRVYTCTIDNLFLESVKDLDDREFLIETRNKLMSIGKSLYCDDAYKWKDLIKRLFLNSNVTLIGLFYTESDVDNQLSTFQLRLEELHMDHLLELKSNTIMLIKR